MQEQLRAGAFVILGIGVILALVSVFADPLALGMPQSGFGWKQITGTIIGLFIAGLGLWLSFRFGHVDHDSR